MIVNLNFEHGTQIFERLWVAFHINYFVHPGRLPYWSLIRWFIKQLDT